METSWASQTLQGFRTPETTERYRNAALGILLIPLVEVVVVPVQLGLDHAQINLPASVLVMILASVLMLFANCIHDGVGSVYARYMKGPTDFLGRHMSFGFVAPCLMLNKDHIDSAKDVPRIAGAFGQCLHTASSMSSFTSSLLTQTTVITSIVSYTVTFVFAAGSFIVEQRARRLRNTADDIVIRRISIFSSSKYEVPRPSTAAEVDNEFRASLGTLCQSPVLANFVVTTTPLWISLFLILTVGIPVYRATKYDMPFEAFCFIFLWIGAVLLQRYIKSPKLLEHWPRVQTSLVILCNPVLITSALGTAYFWTKTAITHKTIDDVLTAFRPHATWAEILTHPHQDARPRIGAGDLATALLDAGIVSLGFKMFEHRRELRNSFVTVFATSLALALLNVFLGVIVARAAAGLPPYEALAFAARNVTIALGVPAVQSLGGSTALMSALCVFSGMLFQMTGDVLFAWLGVRDRPVMVRVPDGGGGGEYGRGDGLKGPCESHGSAAARSGDGDDNYKVVAAGVTVGINAAAMGIALLIERDSRATAYSALSMTVFGSMTVALTAIPAISRTLISLASQ